MKTHHKIHIAIATFCLVLTIVIGLFIKNSHVNANLTDYSVTNFQLAGFVDVNSVHKVKAAFDANIQASDSDITFYKNVTVRNLDGRTGVTSIKNVSANVSDMGTYYVVPAGSTAVISIESVFNPADFVNGPSDINIYFPVSATDTPKPLQSINGVCGATVDSCSAGAFESSDDTSSTYNWKCDGVNGGATVACNKPIATLTSSLCGYVNNQCMSGILMDIADSDTDYLWVCGGSDGVNKMCSQSKIATSTQVSFLGYSLSTVPVSTTSTTPTTTSLIDSYIPEKSSISENCSNTVTGKLSFNNSSPLLVKIYKSTSEEGPYSGFMIASTRLANSIQSINFSSTANGALYYKFSVIENGVESRLISYPPVRPPTCPRPIDNVSVTKNSFFLGDAMNITWHNNGFGVKIELYKGTTSVQTIKGSLGKLGSYYDHYNYVVPSNLLPGNDYMVKVKAIGISYDLIATSSPFEIKKGEITLGSVVSHFVSGHPEVSLTWTNTGNIKNFKIDVISIATGEKVLTGVVKAPVNKFVWKPTTKNIDKYKFVVSDYADAKNSVSSETFDVTLTPPLIATGTVSMNEPEIKQSYLRNLVGNVWNAVTNLFTWFK